MTHYYQVARIVNTFGIKGQVKVLMDTDFVEERFEKGKHLMILNDGQLVQEVTVANLQAHKGAFLLGFKEYNSINQVEGFKGMTLAIPAQDQHALEEDTYYHHQIIGLSVQTLEGLTLGKIKDILQLGSNDVWVVQRLDKGKKDLLLPFIEDVVKRVDLEQGMVEIELMEGLLDED